LEKFSWKVLILAVSVLSVSGKRLFVASQGSLPGTIREFELFVVLLYADSVWQEGVYSQPRLSACNSWGFLAHGVAGKDQNHRHADKRRGNGQGDGFRYMFCLSIRML